MWRVMRLALPMMGSLLSEILMLVVDGIICGHIPDQGLSLVALGFAVQIWFVLVVPTRALEVATVAVTSRAVGADDRDRMNRVVGQSAQLAVVLGVVLGIVGASLGYILVRALGGTPAVSEAGSQYLMMLAIGFPASFLSDGCISAVLRSAGNTRLPLVCNVAANLLNVVLAYSLVFGKLGLPEMGIAGAGLATAISRWVGLALMIIAIRGRAFQGITIRLRPVGWDRPLIRQMLRVGLPSLVEQLIFYLSMTALLVILAHVDEASVAAHGLGARLVGLLLVPSFALSMATGALVGTDLGARAVEDARRVVRSSLIAVVALMAPLAVATFAGTGWITAIYDIAPGSDIAKYTTTWLHVIAFSVVLQGVVLVFEGLLYGAGASSTVMKINLFANLVLRLTLALVLGLGTDLGALGVWLSWPAVLLVQLTLVSIAYHRGRWAVTGATIE